MSRHGAAWGWCAFCALLVAEVLLVRAHARREIVWAYPAMWDQVAIYSRAYLGYDRVRQMGVARGLGPLVARPSPTGALAPPAAAALMLLFGPSRLSALTLNIVWLALAQLALVAALRRLSGGWSAPALGLGLWLSAGTAFVWGGLFDLRLDFGAACLFGAFVSAALASDTLRAAKGAALAGAVALVMVLYRHLTLAYLLAILAALALVLFWRHRGATRQRWRGLAALGATALLPLLPLAPHFWRRTRLYYDGTTMDQAAFARLFGAGPGAHALEALAIYPRSLALVHGGPLFIGLVVLALAVTLFALRRALGHEGAREGVAERAPVPPFDARLAGVFAALAFFAPLALLSAYPPKAPTVAGVLVMPLVWLGALPAVELARRGRAPRLLAALAGATFLAGLLAFGARCAGPGPFAGDRPSARAVVQLYGTIAEISLARGWRAPSQAWDAAADFQLAWLLVPIAYEAHGRLLTPRVTLGHPATAPATQAAVERAVAGSDFVVVTRSGAVDSGHAFDASMRALRPRLLALCDERLTRVARFAIYGREIDLFVRPGAPR